MPLLLVAKGASSGALQLKGKFQSLSGIKSNRVILTCPIKIFPAALRDSVGEVPRHQAKKRAIYLIMNCITPQ